MKKFTSWLLCNFLLVSQAMAGSIPFPLFVSEEDGTNWSIPTGIKVTNGSTTINADGSVSIDLIPGADAINDTHIDWGTGANQVNSDDIPEGTTNYYVHDAFNGSFRESFDADVTSNGTIVTMNIEQTGGGDLITQFSSGLMTYDCTPADTIELTAGSDSSPQSNWIYILQSAPTTLVKSTSSWPTTEHIKVGFFLIQSASSVQSDGGSLINQNWNDHQNGAGDNGHITHIARKVRSLGPTYFSGVDGNGGTASYYTLSASNSEFISTSGIIEQLHPQTFPAFNTSTGGIIHVVNSSVSFYRGITDLFSITTDSTGATISNNKYFNLVFWGTANKTGEHQSVMVNVPGGFYNSQSDAENDVSGYDVFTIPREFSIDSSTGFLICKTTFKMGATWAHVSTVDLRGTKPQTASGGAGGIISSFADNLFNIYDNTDITKVLAVDVGSITTGTTRTLTVQDSDGAILIDTKDIVLDDGVGDSPVVQLINASDDTFTLIMDDSVGNAQLKMNSATDETMNIINNGAGVVDLAVDGTLDVEGMIAVGSGADITPPDDVRVINAWENSSQVLLNDIVISATHVWSPPSNAGAKSMSTIDSFMIPSPETGVTIPYAHNLSLSVQDGSPGDGGVITEMVYLNINEPLNTGDSTATELYGIKMADLSSAVWATNIWGIYQDGVGYNSLGDDLQIREETPSLDFTDTDTTDDDVNVKIYAETTDTGSGTEDADIYIEQMTAGTLTTRMLFDADGSIVLIPPANGYIVSGTGSLGFFPLTNNDQDLGIDGSFIWDDLYIDNIKMTGSMISPTDTIADGDTTPTVLKSRVLTTSANTGATEITDLDNPIVGQFITIIGGSNTNPSTISDSGNFNLSAAWTANLDDVIHLYVQADNDYIQVGREDN